MTQINWGFVDFSKKMLKYKFQEQKKIEKRRAKIKSPSPASFRPLGCSLSLLFARVHSEHQEREQQAVCLSVGLPLYTLDTGLLIIYSPDTILTPQLRTLKNISHPILFNLFTQTFNGSSSFLFNLVLRKLCHFLFVRINNGNKNVLGYG